LAAAGASPEDSGEKAVAWTQAQELALVRAFKEFGKDTPERWDRIASAVPGGFTKVHCQRRMTQLHAHLKEAKGQPTGSPSS
jgi:DnaJ family protein C protein 2